MPRNKQQYQISKMIPLHLKKKNRPPTSVVDSDLQYIGSVFSNFVDPNPNYEYGSGPK